jgi:hypothetical protein
MGQICALDAAQGRPDKRRADGDVLALLGAEGRITTHGLAGVNCGVAGNFEGFLRAVRAEVSLDIRVVLRPRLSCMLGRNASN